MARLLLLPSPHQDTDSQEHGRQQKACQGDCGTRPVCHQGQVWRRGGQRPAESDEGYTAKNPSTFHSYPARGTLGQLSLRIPPPEPLRPHDHHDVHCYLTEVRQAEQLPSVQEA